MSRRAAAPTRSILPDPKFNSVMLAKFMNMVMERGKKSVAEGIVYGAIDRIADKTGRPADQGGGPGDEVPDRAKRLVDVTREDRR